MRSEHISLVTAGRSITGFYSLRDLADTIFAGGGEDR